MIATIIIAGAYVGYFAWEKSLHEKPEKHAEPIELDLYYEESPQKVSWIQTDLKNQIH